MLIQFNTLTLKNYKSHRDLEVKFGDLTKISGDNAKGKSSIPEAVPYLFYGTDAFGNKLDPTPITYEAEETLVQLLLTVDSKPLLLGRGLKKGKAQYYINEVPGKAKEFDEIRDQLFDKDLFMSLYNPSFFPSLHWEKQRELLLRYVIPPARVEVLKHLEKPQSDMLEIHLKKHSLIDLEKIHKDNKNKQDKSYISAQSKTQTLKEQLNLLNKPNLDIDSLKAEADELTTKILEADQLPAQAWENNKKISSLQSEIRFLMEQRNQMKEQFQAIKNEPIEDTCPNCGQPLNDESKAVALAVKQAKMDDFKKRYDQVVIKRKGLEEELSKLEYIDATEQRQKVLELEEWREVIMGNIHAAEQYDRLATQVKSAEADENAILQDLKSSIFILDSLKAYKAKEAELQAQKVQSLFTTLSVRLFKQNKGDGEYKPDFEIQMDGKPYRTLSLSESIRAGLELRDVLSQQSELITPCFVDNAESITRFTPPNGQLIMVQVVPDKELTIDVSE